MADYESASRDFTDGLRRLADWTDDRVAHDLHAAPTHVVEATAPAVLDNARMTFAELIATLDEARSEPIAPCSPSCERPVAPVGYEARAVWMERMSVTHVQRQCRKCGFWTQWEVRE